MNEVDQSIKQQELVSQIQYKLIETLSASEKTYRQLVENVREVLFECDEAGRITFLNRAWTEILGYSTEGCLGHSMGEYLSEEDREKGLALMAEQSSKDHAPMSREVRFLRSDGELMWLMISVRSDDTEGEDRIVGSLHDVDARKRTEEALRESEAKLTGIVDSVRDQMWMVDERFNIVWSNDLARRLFGPDIVGKKCYAVCHGRDSICTPCICKKCFEDGRVHEFETEIIVSDGNQMSFWCTASAAARHEDGRPKMVLEFLRDITERKLAREALQKALDELEQRVEKRTAELVKANEQLMREIDERKRAEEALRKSEEQLDAMLRSIGDHMSMMDKDLNIIWANETAKKVFGDDIIGKKCFEAYHGRKEPCEPSPCLTLKAFHDGKIHEHDTQVIDKDRKILHFHCTANVALRDREGNPTAVIEISRDITDQKRGEASLRKREAELEKQSHHLEQVNTALKVLLKQREEDKKELEENVLSNVKQLVSSHLERLKESRLDADQTTLVSILESNLSNIVSPFISRLSSKFLHLTPMEIRVADLIKEGKTNKEIGALLSLSPNTVKFHRYNLRSKLGLKNKKINLRTHLLSLAK